MSALVLFPPSHHLAQEAPVFLTDEREGRRLVTGQGSVRSSSCRVRCDTKERASSFTLRAPSAYDATNTALCPALQPQAAAVVTFTLQSAVSWTGTSQAHLVVVQHKCASLSSLAVTRLRRGYDSYTKHASKRAESTLKDTHRAARLGRPPLIRAYSVTAMPNNSRALPPGDLLKEDLAVRRREMPKSTSVIVPPCKNVHPIEN
ncbi:hypothetical protein EV714DRAFT_278210 [Schizophyllum commune]